MTVPVQVPFTTIISALNQAIFPFNFRCDDATQIHTFLADVESFVGVVALNADQAAAPGGTVTLPPQATGVKVSIERQGPQQQSVAIATYGPFASATMMTALDKVIMLLQEIWAKLSRAVTVSRANAALVSSSELPTPLVGTILGWVDAGGGLSKLANVVISAIAAQTEVWGEAVTRTGAGLYQLAHAPNSPAKVRLFLNGGRLVLNTHYTMTAGGAITQLPGFISASTEDLRADYAY